MIFCFADIFQQSIDNNLHREFLMICVNFPMFKPQIRAHKNIGLGDREAVVVRRSTSQLTCTIDERNRF